MSRGRVNGRSTTRCQRAFENQFVLFIHFNFLLGTWFLCLLPHLVHDTKTIKVVLLLKPQEVSFLCVPVKTNEISVIAGVIYLNHSWVIPVRSPIQIANLLKITKPLCIMEWLMNLGIQNRKTTKFAGGLRWTVVTLGGWFESKTDRLLPLL